MDDVKGQDGKGEEFEEEIVDEDEESYDEEVVESEGDDDIVEEEVIDSGSEADSTPAPADSSNPGENSTLPSFDDAAYSAGDSRDGGQSTQESTGFTDFATFSPSIDEETGRVVSAETTKVTNVSGNPSRTPAMGQGPIPVDSDFDSKYESHSSIWYWLVCLLVCGLLAGGGYAGWYLVNEDGSDTPNLKEGENQTRAPTQAPTPALVTTFDPVQGNCKLKALSDPHPIDQCRCNGEIATIAEDIQGRYEVHLTSFISSVYGEYPDDISSCTARNQALVWLSSGNDYQFTEEERTERFALATLYASLSGSNWTSQGQWLSEEGICTWQAVTCDDQGFVENLVLSDNSLKGIVSIGRMQATINARQMAAPHTLSTCVPHCSSHPRLHF